MLDAAGAVIVWAPVAVKVPPQQCRGGGEVVGALEGDTGSGAYSHGVNADEAVCALILAIAVSLVSVAVRRDVGGSLAVLEGECFRTAGIGRRAGDTVEPLLVAVAAVVAIWSTVSAVVVLTVKAVAATEADLAVAADLGGDPVDWTAGCSAS